MDAKTEEKKKEVILIVDDNPENIEVLIGSLQSTGYTLRAATTGEEALRIISMPDPPDLVLLDIMMPDMDGLEVCRRIKNDIRTSHIPIIFVTARVSTEDEAEGFEAGAVDYIHKPIGPSVVRARVATHLALSNQNRELRKKVKEATREIAETRREIVRRLGVAAEFRDNETGAHIIRVGCFVEILALEFGLEREKCQTLREASQMHDLGKIGIADQILLKPGIYTPEEKKEMEKHCEIGGRIIGESDAEILKMARSIALYHHEKWNGKGYPFQLSGEQIPFEARLTSIADVFDALTSRRPYKEPWPLDRVLELLNKESGVSFDPAVVDIFLKSLDKIKQVMVENPDE